MKQVLLVPKVHIHNANALSSPYTIGFPAMTAWFGAVHALERRLKSHETFKRLQMSGVAIICHEINLQTYKDLNDPVYSIIGRGSPLDVHGQRRAFVEEARCHLNVSLVIQCKGLNGVDPDHFIKTVTQYLITMKMASGDVFDFEHPRLIELQDHNEFKQLMNCLIPGYCLIERRDLMRESMGSGLDAIEALLDHLIVMHRCGPDKYGRVKWHSTRKKNGWIVPIAVGFQGISDLKTTDHQRDPDTLHCFAESIVTLGEFVMPYRIKDLKSMLWYPHVDLKRKFYLYQQN